MLINQGTLNALNKSFSLIFQTAFDGIAPLWPRVGMSVQTSTKEQQYGFLGAFPKMREWVGDREMQNLLTHDFTIKNKDYEATIEIDRNDIEDDNIGIFNPVVQEFARVAATHPDELIFGLFGSGNTNKCYDGKAFFADNHPVGKQSASNYANGAGTPWYLLDVSRAIKAFVFQRRRDLEFVSLDNITDPQVFMKRQYMYGIDVRYNAGYGLWQLAYRSEMSLEAANYAEVRAAMMSYKDAQGRPLGIMPNLLIVPPSLEGDARALLMNDRNDAGATNTWRATSELLVVPWL
jgi:phage major head subunit gpT-like protein